MTTQQVSGGDVYIKKLISLSDNKLSVVLSAQAQDLLSENEADVVYTTDNRSTNSNSGIVLLYLVRAVKSIFHLIITKRLFKRHDVVLASSPFVCDILPATFCRADNRAVILFHLIPKRSATTYKAKVRFILARLEQAASLIIIRWRFNTVLVGNIELKNQLTKRFPNKKIVVAHAGINTKEIDAVTNAKRDPNLAVFVGRLTTQKGILDLVDIAKSVSLKHPKFRLIVIGDGPHREILEQKIDQFGGRNIELMGFIDKTEKYKLMKSAQFFLFPSYEEGWGIALAEGLYAGCHCFCYEIEHYRGIFSDFPEYIKMGDSESFARSILSGYTKKTNTTQVAYVGQYEDALVTRDVLNSLV